VSIDSIYASLNQLAVAVDALEQELARKEAEKEAAAKAAKAAPQPQPQQHQPQQQPQQQQPAAQKSGSLPGLPGQNDLFSDWKGGNKVANANAAALAKKLDNAIDNVQWLLKEAGAKK